MARLSESAGRTKIRGPPDLVDADGGGDVWWNGCDEFSGGESDDDALGSSWFDDVFGTSSSRGPAHRSRRLAAARPKTATEDVAGTATAARR